MDGESEIMSRREECVHHRHPASHARVGRRPIRRHTEQQSFTLMQTAIGRRSCPSLEMLDNAHFLFSAWGAVFSFGPLSFATNQGDSNQPSKWAFYLFVYLPGTEIHSHYHIRNKGFMSWPWEKLNGCRATL